MVADEPEGHLIMTPEGVWAGARLPDDDMLNTTERAHLQAAVDGWQSCASHLPRGDAHAAICAKFFGGGYKGDQDARMAMNHSAVGGEAAAQLKALDIQKQLRTLLTTTVMPKVRKYFADLLDAPRELLRRLGVGTTFVDYFTSITCGHLFYNRAHSDNDLWITILVALGDCECGGGFVHPGCGVVQAVRAGDVLVVNPCVEHCTSEFGDELSSRRMVAIFVSENAFRACATSVSVAESNALSVCQGKAKRRKR